jgi:uncharacterized protein YdaL
MKKLLFLLLLSLCFSVSIKAQDAEKDAVKRVVETYLFSENDDERKQTLYNEAKIFSTDTDGKKIEQKRFTSSKRVKGARIISLQKVISIDVFEDAATVKVETDLSDGDIKIPKHYQYISLLKTNGAWKIVSILMPKIKLAQ